MPPRYHSSKMLLALAISVLGFGASLLSSIVVARVLGADGKGVFSLFQVTVYGITSLAGFGIGQGQMFHALRNPERMRYFVANSYAVAIAEGLVIAVVLLVARRLEFVQKLSAAGTPTLISAIVAVPVLSMLVFQRQYLLAAQAYEASKLNMVLSQVLPLIVYVMLYLRHIYSVPNVIAGFVGSQLLCVVLYHVYIARIAPQDRAFSWSFLKESLSFGMFQYLSDLALFLTSRLDFFLVAWLAGVKGLGLYSVAVALAEITFKLPSELGTLLFPAFAGSHISRGQAAAILRTTVCLSILMALALGVMSGPIVGLLFGPQFSASIPAFRLLLVGAVAWSTIFVTWNHASACGRPWLGLPIFGAVALIDGALDILLIPRYGVAGAGIAAAVSYWIAAFVFLRVFRQQENWSAFDVLVVRRSDLYSVSRAIVNVVHLFAKAIVRPKLVGERE